jgi:peptidyl-dipeptidase Dcp
MTVRNVVAGAVAVVAACGLVACTGATVKKGEGAMKGEGTMKGEGAFRCEGDLAGDQSVKCGVAASVPAVPTNPFLQEWTTPFGVPPFDQIKESDFLPAIKAGIDAQRAEVAAIADNPDAPTFKNTVIALDDSGALLDKVEAVFYNLQSAETTPGIQAIAKEISPLTTALNDDIFLNRKLFARVDAVWKVRDTLGLDPVQVRLVDEMRKVFVRAGAGLDDAAQARLREINKELAMAGLNFGDNLLAETNAFQLVIESPEDLAGLNPSTVAAAAQAAEKVGMEGNWLVTLSYPSMWPFLQQSTRRELRQQVITAYQERCNRGNANDNNEIINKIEQFRLEKAKLLGYPTWADFVLEERMAKNPANVRALLNRLWKPALAVAKKEAAEYTKAARRDGLKGPFMPWDWHYYAEKTRAARYGLDSAVLRQYFRLDDVLAGAFGLANRLYGITFTPVEGLNLYHPDVRAWEVKDADGSHLGLFLGDYHPRPGKRVGAWASRYRGQHPVNGREVRPIVVNVCNFSGPSSGPDGDVPALLSPDETETLFHELGHGIHSLLSRVPYNFLESVPRDFVELPSQIMENWVFEPEMLRQYARHYKTGEPIPADLIAKIEAAARHNQGFATVEYLAASLLDMAWQEAKTPDYPPAQAFEKAEMARIGLPAQIIPRYRSTYFNHIFGGSGSYSAGYYSYIWSEVLDADAFAAFKQAGNLFDPATATSFRKNILELGGTVDAAQMYRNFRGRDPEVKPLLERRGLVPAK